jgi:hypothetical protein
MRRHNRRDEFGINAESLSTSFLEGLILGN